LGGENSPPPHDDAPPNPQKTAPLIVADCMQVGGCRKSPRLGGKDFRGAQKILDAAKRVVDAMDGKKVKVTDGHFYIQPV